METVLARTLDFNGMTAADLALVELYSCFPVVPKLARRSLGWPEDRPVSTFGGLTFGGAPVANYMSHAVVAMTRALRGTADRGLLYANGGIVTTNHAIVISGAPLDTALPRDPDVQAEADAKRAPAPALDEDHEGPVTVESWTVLYDRQARPARGIVVARTPSGARTLAEVPAEDAALIATLTDGALDPVGLAGRITAADGTRRFTR
jgi:acetyl-CoA C-acetyltransferase